MKYTQDKINILTHMCTFLDRNRKIDWQAGPAMSAGLDDSRSREVLNKRGSLLNLVRRNSLTLNPNGVLIGRKV